MLFKVVKIIINPTRLKLNMVRFIIFFLKNKISVINIAARYIKPGCRLRAKSEPNMIDNMRCMVLDVD
jgi:hypothetical protein